jgi:putative transposase
MVRSGVISDELCAVVEPVLPSGEGCRGRPWNDHPQTLEGICWRFRGGSPWRDLPGGFGAWQSVCERHRRWSVDGTHERMFAAVRFACPDIPDGDDMVRLLGVDSTRRRAHQHAAGSPGAKRAESNHKNPSGEPDDHALGRSSGGLTT